MSEDIPCKNGHEWNGVKPSVDQNIMQYQNYNLTGTVCDCGKMIYWEGECGCSVKHWEIQLKENS